MARSDHAERIDRVYAAIEARLTAWASEEPTVRAAIVLGSRARDDHPADAWADLDVVLITVEAERLCADRDWLTAIGRPAITFVELTGGDVRELRVMFEGGFDLDLALMTPDQIEGLQASAPETAMMAFGRGHRVLVDKDGQAARMLESMPAAVEHGAPPRPSADDFREACSDFWYHTVWTAKHLTRGEMWWARSCCDGYLKALLQRMLEWQARGEGRDAWFRGRFFEEWADPDTLAGLRSAYAHFDSEEVWSALFVTMDLFGDLARRMADVLDLPYDESVEAHA